MRHFFSTLTVYYTIYHCVLNLKFLGAESISGLKNESSQCISPLYHFKTSDDAKELFGLLTETETVEKVKWRILGMKKLRITIMTIVTIIILEFGRDKENWMLFEPKTKTILEDERLFSSYNIMPNSTILLFNTGSSKISSIQEIIFIHLCKSITSFLSQPHFPNIVPTFNMFGLESGTTYSTNGRYFPANLQQLPRALLQMDFLCTTSTMISVFLQYYFNNYNIRFAKGNYQRFGYDVNGLKPLNDIENIHDLRDYASVFHAMAIRCCYMKGVFIFDELFKLAQILEASSMISFIHSFI